MEKETLLAKMWPAKILVVAGLLGLLITYLFVLCQQLNLSAWHKAWRLQRTAPPAAPSPWTDYDPNFLELRVNAAIARAQEGQTQDAQQVAHWLRRMKTIRPGWPYYLLLEQQWFLSTGHMNPQAWVRVLQKGLYEPEIAQTAGVVFFQNWEDFTPEQRHEMLALLWGAGSRVQGRLINAAFLSSRLFEYCDYGYNTALDTSPECRKAGWRPLESPVPAPH